VGAGRFFGFEKGYRIPEIFQYAFRTKQVPPDDRLGDVHVRPARLASTTAFRGAFPRLGVHFLTVLAGIECGGE
jgi:hypothetical protein